MGSIKEKSAMIFVTLGVGKIPFAPGTWGSLLAWVLLWVVQPAWPLTVGLIVAVFLASLPAIQLYEKSSGRHDPKEVIIDEVVGQWIALLAVPFSPAAWVAGFVLFRLFDILKPFPVGWVDREMPGAWGTLLDDVVAGVLARGVLAVALGLGWL